MTDLIVTGRDPRGSGGLRIVIDGEAITSIEATPDPGVDTPWISPGLIDVQINGHGLGDANAASPSVAAVEQMCASVLKHGVTQFLPTVITASPEQMLTRITAIADAVRMGGLAAHMVAGIHVEGPALSPEDGPRGVHPLEHIRPLSFDEIDSWLAVAPDLIRVVTLSPHHAGTPSVVAGLAARGVRVAIGHTHANDAEILAAVDAGVSLSTHLGNGAHRELPRHPNYLWTQLAEPRLRAGLIADGHHLPDSVLLTSLRAKGDDGVFLVSDAVATGPALLEDGQSSIGGGVEVATDGALRHVATGLLAGSIQSLDVGVATMARLTGSLARALDLATVAPSRAVGLPPLWAVGSRADVITFTWKPGDTSLALQQVIVAGKQHSSITE